jgi:glutamate formiminotransferase / 5-formyltetrahydrofolate cyclo-ligase
VTGPPVTTLLAVPNISEGRNEALITEIAEAFGGQRLNLHSDPDHHRSVVTIAGHPGGLADAVLQGARAAVERLDIRTHQGVHPRIGVVDVAPIVYLADSERGAACAEALVLGDLLGDELELPVFLYGALGGGRTRAELRRGGPEQLGKRMAAGELHPDFGPPRLHPTAGAVLVAARAPLLAFNVELAPPATLADATSIAAQIREGGSHGLPGVRALGIWLEQRQRAQVSLNVEDHREVRLVTVVDAIGQHAEIAEAELVGLAPRAAFEGFPEDIPVRNRATIEDALTACD